MAEYGKDYDLERWSTGGRDEEGHIIWHERFPDNDEWDRVRVVTVNLNPGGDPVYRNYPVDPDFHLDPYGEGDHDLDWLVQSNQDFYAQFEG